MQHLRKNGRLQKVLGWSWIPPLLSHKQKAVIAIWQFSVALCYSDFWWIKSHFNVDMSDTLLETICINGTRPPYKRPAWVIGQVGSEELQNRRVQTATSRERQNHSSYDKRRPKWVTRIYNFCCKLIAATVSAHSLRIPLFIASVIVFTVFTITCKDYFLINHYWYGMRWSYNLKQDLLRNVR